MIRIVRSMALILLCSSLCFAQVIITGDLAETGVTQTGFVIVSPVVGTGGGMLILERLTQLTGAGRFDAVILPSPLAISTQFPVTLNPATSSFAALAIANPNGFPATVTLALRNQNGSLVTSRVITIGAGQQSAAFVHDFLNQPQSFTTMGLLSLQSTIGVSAVALAFRGPDFDAIPATAQLFTGVGTGVPSLTTFPPPPPPTGFTFGLTTGTFTGSFGTGVTPTLPGTQFPSNLGIISPSPVLPPQPMPPQTTAQFRGSTLTSTTPQQPTFNISTDDGVIGGAGSVLFPQFASGGGWMTEIILSNTSGVSQVMRVDFFSPSGNRLTSILNITVPPGGTTIVSPGTTLF